MILINGGIPRSGTVLVCAVLRALLEARGMAPEVCNPSDGWQLDALLERDGLGAERPVLIHTHHCTGTLLTRLRAGEIRLCLWNHREPRDALVSLIALHDLDFETGLAALRQYLAMRDHIVAAGLATPLAYERIVADRRGLIRALAQMLHLEIGRKEVEAIADQTDIARHRSLMPCSAQPGQPIRRIKTRFREVLEDPQTLLNDRHIQSGRAGRWRSDLPRTHHAQAAQELWPWIDALGYA
ncbi:MAG: hypothetical protein AAFR17_12715 [Pseudomonadota bacterium]